MQPATVLRAGEDNAAVTMKEGKEWGWNIGNQYTVIVLKIKKLVLIEAAEVFWKAGNDWEIPRSSCSVFSHGRG